MIHAQRHFISTDAPDNHVASLENPHPPLPEGPTWYLCQHPEVPPNEEAMASEWCLPCMIGAQAAFRSGEVEAIYETIVHVNERIEYLRSL